LPAMEIPALMEPVVMPIRRCVRGLVRGKILGFDEPAASCTTIAEVGVVAGAAAECGTAAPLINARFLP
jgi:hypothetical protein